MDHTFLNYYRCPDRYADFGVLDSATNGSSGYFRFGDDLICHGVSTAACHSNVRDPLPDLLPSVRFRESSCTLPFNLSDVVTNIRQERYIVKTGIPLWRKIVHGTYYLVRPCLTVPVRRHLQRAWLKGWDHIPFPSWPVDCTVDKIFEQAMSLSLKANKDVSIPFIWFWPEGKSSCAIMTHDVETAAGLEFCNALMDLDDSFTIKSSFQIIPEDRYSASSTVLKRMRDRGFEINVHDLKHDGHLFRDKKGFQAQAARINSYAQKFGSKGFRAGALYRNPEWYGEFHFSYDMSVPNIGHLESQPGGCCTVMPFYIGSMLELPVTTTQDYSLFNILGRYSIDLWQQQIDIIRRHNGLISFIVHPDYLTTIRARTIYEQLLQYLSNLRSDANVWIPTPGEVDAWWRQRSQMKLVQDGSSWRIEGAGANRAKIAYASLFQDSVVYSVN
jgi:hypothetical protein